MVLQGLELGLGERIVIRHLRSAQRAGHPEIGEELSRALARHRSSSIRVQGQDLGLDAMLQATLLDQAPGQGRALPIRHHPSHDVAAEDVHDNVEVEVAPLPRPQQPCDIPGPDLARARRHQLGFLVFGMTPLRSALSNWHLGGQNAIHRTFAAQVDVFVEQGRHNLGRGPVHESLRTQRVEDLVSFLLAQGTGWGRAGLLMPGRWPPTTIERGSGDPERIARGLYPYVRGQRLGRLHEFVPSSRLNPSSPATFPWTSRIRRAFSSSFSRRVFSRSSLRTFPSSGFRSLGFRPRLFDSALSDPLRTALRHVVRCDEYKPSRRRSRPTSPGSVHRSASSTTRSLYDGLNRRRVGLSATSASGAAAALRLPSQVSGAIPFSSILSRCLSILGFSAFALL